jgi:hypothetical protein
MIPWERALLDLGAQTCYRGVAKKGLEPKRGLEPMGGFAWLD